MTPKQHSTLTLNLEVPTALEGDIVLALKDEDNIYEYKDGSGLKIKGTQFNTAGWTAVEVAGKIVEKIGPILATKY